MKMVKPRDDFTVSHFDICFQECRDQHAASRWAWKCLEDLAAVFCEHHCLGSKCNKPAKNSDPFADDPEVHSEQAIQKQWEDAQRQLHEAMAHLPEFAMLVDTCPACAIAEAFSCFPLIARHSPRPPVATVKMNGVDCYPDVVFYGGDQRASFPCVIVETTLTDFETQTEERLRERALLAIDASDLPPMPPNELDKIKKKLIPGQSVAKRLDYLRNNAPTEEKLRERTLKESLKPAIVSAVALRDLIRILYYYPDAIDNERAQELHKELVQSLEIAMVAEEMNPIKELYARPEYGDHHAETNLSVLFGLLVAMHPEMDSGDGAPQHIQKAFQAIVHECTEQTSGPLRELVDELIHTKMYNCRIPRPAGDPIYAEKGRFVQMIDHYWSLCKKVITYQLDAGIYAPDAILPLMTNLRGRVEACFAELGSLEGVAEVQQAFSGLVDTCTSPEFDDLQAVPEWTRGEIHKIDAFLASANTTVRRRKYPLTDEERIFIEQSNRELDEFHAFLNKKWKAMLANAEARGKHVTHKADVTPPCLAGEYPKDKFVVERRKVDEQVHWFVNGEDRGAFYARPDTCKAKIIEALYDQIGRGWVPHKTFMNACGWTDDAYHRSSENPGCMQRQLTDIRKFLGVSIEFRKDKGVRFAENVVKSK